MKRKIIVVGPIPPPYHGVAMMTQYLLESLECAELIDPIHLDTTDRRDISNLGLLDIKNIYLALLHSLIFIGYLLVQRPEIVYLPISKNILAYLRDLLFLFPSYIFRRQVIIHWHGAGFREFYETCPKMMQLLIKESLKRAARIIVLGKALRFEFAEFLTHEKIVSVPNGIPDFFSTNLSFERKREAKQRYVLWLSNLMSEKGLFIALEVARILKQTMPKVKLIFAGDWFREKDRIESLKIIEDLHLENVEFVGTILGTEKFQLFRRSDLFLFPPISPEGFGLVNLEAMSAGLPVVSTSQGAIPETVLDGVTGFVVEPGLSSAIAEKIVYLLKNDELRERMGRASRERFLKYYTLDRWVGDMMRVFQEVLAGN